MSKIHPTINFFPELDSTQYSKELNHKSSANKILKSFFLIKGSDVGLQETNGSQGYV